jgi:hypothetical protein
LPVNRAEGITIGYQDSPKAIKNPQFHPALECAMYRTVIAELRGQLVPLYAAAQPIDDPIQGAPLVDPLAPPAFRRIMCRQDGLDHRPKLIRYPPDCGQRFRVIVSFPSGHLFPPNHQGPEAIIPQNWLLR